MLFNSIHFLIFFPIITIVYFLLSYKHRWILLLIASYYFYMCWKPEYIILIFTSTVIDYVAALKMYSSKGNKRKLWLLMSLISNLGILFFFKYANFFSSNINDVFNLVTFKIPYSTYLLPVGISFYTFQTLSYSIDVYQGKLKPQKHFGKFALFVSFFPQLVAGPIERATHLLPQFDKNFDFDRERVFSGLRLMLWGLFKKVVIADRLSVYVNTVYNNVGDYQGFPLIWATYFFAFQIYCDFSGYSDIAIGAARVMGFDLMKNFNVPYISKSIKEFWARWHISLSTWFRDYLYIPIGGNKVSKNRWYLNLMIVFVVSGFWHGANWTFIVWGFLHGLYLILAIVIGKKFSINNSFFGRTLKIFITFHLVVFAWIFFRANSMSDAFYVIQNISNVKPGLIGVSTFTLNGFLLCFLAIAFLVPELIIGFFKIENLYEKYSYLKFVIPLFLVIIIYLVGIFEEQEFIYFQF